MTRVVKYGALQYMQIQIVMLFPHVSREILYIYNCDYSFGRIKILRQFKYYNHQVILLCNLLHVTWWRQINKHVWQLVGLYRNTKLLYEPCSHKMSNKSTGNYEDMAHWTSQKSMENGGIPTGNHGFWTPNKGATLP